MGSEAHSAPDSSEVEMASKFGVVAGVAADAVGDRVGRLVGELAHRA
jgi:hypothetical protein